MATPDNDEPDWDQKFSNWNIILFSLRLFSEQG